MASVLPVVLFCLLFQAASAITMDLCMLDTNNMTKWMNSSYELMIEPGYYRMNTVYNVTISGIDSSVSVSLSAAVYNSSFGTWTDGSKNCSGIMDYRNMSTVNMWTSPENMSATVMFRAYVKNSTEFYLLTKSLMTPEYQTTMPPVNTTYNNTMAPNTTTTAATTTRNGSGSFQPLGAFAITLMVLLSATTKQLLL
ncbi:uncharacterized protein LOC103180307 [Callorhinchus milii]|uniref:uncharacterized protein LOC103180307 n=1 Tax=Callorhinchus milii TaxID=7868 RepID=UPI00045730A7|nr:uncharacterized protein LOC103180307 [Callorhinchus milii]|eukprot:gi/632957068/ref/XP_007894277.1/ PREDICTED: uncharacterized protein LOC103180307 [Callorhinchus milii]